MRDVEPKWISRGAFLAVAASFAAFHELTAQFTYEYWNIFAPIRVAALLLVPRRYWSALVIGEWIPIMLKAMACADVFGIEWTLLMCIPVIVACMPAIVLASRVGQLRRDDGEINAMWLIVVVAICSLFTAGLNDAALIAALDASPHSWPDINGRDTFFIFLLGAFPASLTIVPSLLAVREVFVARRSETVWRALARPRTGGLIAASLLTWGCLAVFAPHAHGPTLDAVRLGTLLPVVALTMRFGWQGSALSGLIASIVMAATSISRDDMPLVEMQAFLSLVIAVTLLAGVPVTRRHRERRAARRIVTASSNAG